MSYTNVMTRGTAPVYSTTPGTHPLIPEDVSRDVLKAIPEKSAVLEMFKHRTMSSAQQRMPMLASKPVSFWVNGDTGLKQTTSMAWTNKFLDAEEIATIVPIPEKLLDDADYDIWGEIKPEIVEAMAIALDEAVLFGYNKPSSWPAAIVVAAIAAGNVVVEGSTTVDVAQDVNAVMATVEADGYDVTGFFMKNSLKAAFRGLRDADKGLIFQPQTSASVAKSTWTGDIWGVKAVTSKAGMFEQEDLGTYGRAAQSVKLIAGDFSQGIIGIRQDVTWKMLDQAVISDADGNIVFNLPQQDMVALRCVARYGFQVPNPYNRMQVSEAARYPFGVLRDTT